MNKIIKAHVKDTVYNEKIKIPPHWKNQPLVTTTRTDLKNLQRAEFVPDKSYDIDGDGSVGNKDYVSCHPLTS